MAIQTKKAFSEALARLQKRDPAELAHFIASLALQADPIGEQACTFIVGDELDETHASIRERIRVFQDYEPHEYTYRHQFGADVGQRLMFIVESIETLILPKDLRGAFEVLALVIESEGHAMQTCGEHHEAVTDAIERAGNLICSLVRLLPRFETLAILRKLATEGEYGGRRHLLDLLSEIDVIE
jgi:hypothetical protein